MERGALVFNRFYPDSASVALEDSVGDGQTDARAGKLVHSMQTLEGDEEFPGVGLIETRAIIPHVKRRLASGLYGAKLDVGALAFAGVFPGVANEILQHGTQQIRVSLRMKVRSDRPLDRPDSDR